METNEILLKTIFCCMACDGDIAKEEIALVKELGSRDEAFKDIDIEEKINEYVAGINNKGSLFLKQYLKELAAGNLSPDCQLQVADLAIKTIFADNKVEYSEVKFFKKIRAALTIPDEDLLPLHSDMEDFLLPDINVAEDPELDEVVFASIDLK